MSYWGIGLVALDQQKPELARVGTHLQIAVRARMRVIPPRSRRLWRKGIAMRLAGADHRRAFLHRAIVQRVDCQSVPVNDIGFGRRVCHVDGDGHALSKAKQRPRNLAVVCRAF